MSIKKTDKELVVEMVECFKKVMSKERMLNSYKWFSLATGIRNDEKVEKILKEVLEEGSYFK